ncbi:Mitogen-activated protein [Rhizoctonia solani]|uniref:Mitogen-activated protein kinase CPK1 n=1 Tax=Rhizoctonia solani TaxID=456999 RepID=A0A8H7IL35_9AGAM|nr:Mitogen-activated protein [Rhizoctonia solani]
MESFNVGEHYQVTEVIGEGAYGVVVSATHKASQRVVAIKKISPFDHSMFCLRTLREIKLLRHFQHENIISILDLLRPASFEDFKEVYLVQERMETDMHRVIRTQELSDDHCQYFIYQVGRLGALLRAHRIILTLLAARNYQTLRALKALHSANVLHRDLKPSNLLLNANCDLKLCDFGLARSALPPPSSAVNDASTFMTEYVATRWYRAPEVMLTFKEYTRAIDIWSVGCVLAEMLSGKPLFPGRDYHHQLSLILEVLGTPSLDDFYAINSTRSREYIRALPFRKKKNFATLFPNANPMAVDLMEKCLTFNPQRRIGKFNPYHDEEDEPGAPPLDASFFDFDNGVELPKEQRRRLFDAIFRVLDDRSQRYLVATCRAFRSHCLSEAWQTLTFGGPGVKSQLKRFVYWVDTTRHSSLEGEQNTDIQDDDIANLLVRLTASLTVLSIDLPPMPEDQLFDKTLSRIARLPKLQRLFLGRVKVHDGYDVACDYTELKEATMIWCHGIVEQKLLVDQFGLEHLDVHDSWDIGNLSMISYQWHNLKSFRFSAVDHTYATKILESGRGAMTSLEEVSIEVPMSNDVFFRIVSELSNYPIQKFHLCLSAIGLEVFHDLGRNYVPDDFGPNWLAYISNNMAGLKELVLDYRAGGSRFTLQWPGDQTMYAGALAFAQNLHTLAISIHALPRCGRFDCRQFGYMYFEHIPNLQTLHFPAMPLIPMRSLDSFYSDMGLSPSPALIKGYTMIGRQNQPNHFEDMGDTYRPFWITNGPDVAVDRHRRGGGLRIVAYNRTESVPDDSSDAHVFDELMDELLAHEADFFDQEDVDLGLWFPELETEDEGVEDDDDENDEDWTTSDGEDHDDQDPPPPTSEEWMQGLTIGVSNVNLGINQLDFSELDGHSSSDGDALEDINDSDLSADL